mmetsp:Transcript_12134/g.55154  ORF Transcript_12134/g.55154 Transcript_12134/m.55154 type:complete len:205 (+) Transcript_12134:2204-2818(+)
MWSLGSNGSPSAGSNFTTPCFPKADVNCFSTMSTPSCREVSTVLTLAASVSVSRASVSTVADALARLSATSRRSLQKPWMANFSAVSACRLVRSLRFSMSASVRRSLSFRSLTCAAFSSSSAVSLCTSSSAKSSPSTSSPSSAASAPSASPSSSASSSSFFSPEDSALKGRAPPAISEHANDGRRWPTADRAAKDEDGRVTVGT